MPNYRCEIPKDSIPFEKRQKIALSFTDIHCGSTGAPRSFVNVVFDEQTESNRETPYYIDGGNRAGRPEEVRDQLLLDLRTSFAEIADVPVGSVGGRIVENKASQTMEGGIILPEPGQEGAEWYALAAAND